MVFSPAPAVHSYQYVLTNVLRLTQNQSDTLKDEGYDTAQELCFWDMKDISEWCTNKTKLSAARGGCSFGNPRMLAIQAFAFWATDMHKRGLPLALTTFDGALLTHYKEMVRVERARKSQSLSIELPEPLGTTQNWEDWENALINYLQSRDSINKIPLSYVIRPDTRPDSAPDATPEQIRLLDLIHNAESKGPAYNTDSAQVFGIIDSLTIGQDSANWISIRCRQTRNGRLAMSQLKGHFDGAEEKYKRHQLALTMLGNTHYKHEKMMTFATFSTRLKKCFDTISICDQPYSEPTKVDMLLRRIKSSSNELSQVVTLIRTDTVKYNTFIKATQELAKHVAILYPEVSYSGNGRHKRKIHLTKNSGGGSSGSGGTGESHKIITKNGKSYCNNIDVTEQTRSFSSKEWKALPFSFKKILFNNPNRKKNSKKQKTEDERETSSATTVTNPLNNNTIGRIISGVARATLVNNETVGSIPSVVLPPRMGAGGAAQRQAAATTSLSSNTSVITNDTRWDHNGNIISK